MAAFGGGLFPTNPSIFLANIVDLIETTGLQ